MESALNAHSGLDSPSGAWDTKGMQSAAGPAGKQAVFVFALAALVAGMCAGLFACRHGQASEGAGGQSGDEGRRPRGFVDGAGGGTAELP